MIETFESLDRALLLKINSFHSPALDVLMWYLSETWPTVLIVLMAAWLVHRKFSLKKAVEFIVGCAMVVACSDMTANLIKHQVKRYRPTHNLEIKARVYTYNNYSGGKYGFVSGHSANTFAVVTFIYLSLYWTRKKYRLLLYIYPVLVVYSRMYLGVHYPSDIATGMLIGLFFGFVGFRLFNHYFLKFDAHAA
jgi:undecaprenyl-diphosphatase